MNKSQKSPCGPTGERGCPLPSPLLLREAGAWLKLHEDILVAHDELARQPPRWRDVVHLGMIDLLLGDLAGQLEHGFFLFGEMHAHRLLVGQHIDLHGT